MAYFRRKLFALVGVPLAILLMGATFVAIDLDPEDAVDVVEVFADEQREIARFQEIEAANQAAHQEDGVKILIQEEEDAAAAQEPKQFYEDELIKILKVTGFEGKALKEAWAVAMKESTGNPNAHNQNSRTGDNSYGLFQINMIGRLGPARLEKFGLNSYEDLLDPYTNARVAFEMSKGGTNWGHWGIGPDAYNGGTAGSFYVWLKKYPGG